MIIWLVILGILASPLAIPIVVLFVFLFVALVFAACIVFTVLAFVVSLIFAGIVALLGVFWAGGFVQRIVCLGMSLAFIGAGLLGIVALIKLTEILVRGIVVMFKRVFSKKEGKV